MITVKDQTVGDSFIYLEDEDYGVKLLDAPKRLDETQYGFCGTCALYLTEEQARELGCKLLKLANKYAQRRVESIIRDFKDRKGEQLMQAWNNDNGMVDPEEECW